MPTIHRKDENLLEQHLETVETAINHVCRRQCLYGDEAQEFASRVFVRLLENDCAVLRKFSGKCRMSTYLSVVILNLARDFRIARWGRWRPSAAAKRLGALAIQLETLTVRDGYSLREAGEILRCHEGVVATQSELEDLAAQFPSRCKMRQEYSVELDELPAEASAEHELLSKEVQKTMAQTRAALREAMSQLDSEDQLILKMRFSDDLRVVTIARQLGLEPQPLYRRIQRSLKALRRQLEARGLRAAVLA